MLDILVIALLATAAALLVVLRRYLRMRAETAQIIGCLDGLPGAFAVWSDKDRLLASNERYREVHSAALTTLGRNCSYEDLMRRTLQQVLPPDEIEEAVRARVLAQRQGDGRPQDRAYPNGSWLRVTKTVMADGCVSGFGQDVTEFKHREQELRSAYEAAGLGSWRVTAEDHLSLAGFCQRLMGLDEQAEIETVDQLLSCFVDEDRERMLAAIERALSEQAPCEIELKLCHPKLGERNVHLYLRPDSVDGSKGKGLLGVVQDITERVRQARELEKLAYHDVLTTLPNRAMFEREVTRRIAQHRGQSGRLTFMIIDLDHFKEVNDTLGHPAGDELLVELAGRMSASLRPCDLLARLGGDEFAILLQPVPESETSDVVAERLQSITADPFTLSGQVVRVSLSIGIAHAPIDGSDLSTLMRKADLALYQAKDAGRGCHRYYDAKVFENVTRQRDWSRALSAAIENDELDLQFQPVVNIATQQTFGAAADLSWKNQSFDSTFGFESTIGASAIAEAGSWMITQACREAAAWGNNGDQPKRLFIRLTTPQLWQLDLQREVERALEQSGLQATALSVELPEALLDDRSRKNAVDAIVALHGIGVRIGVGTFNGGYPSLEALRDLPLDHLHIAPSFLEKVEQLPSQRLLLEGLVKMSQGMGTAPIIEGVSNSFEADLVQSLGCRYARGDFFAPTTLARELGNHSKEDFSLANPEVLTV